MTEAATEPSALAPGTPPAVAPNGSEAGTNPPGAERPAWLQDEKFWDGEAKTVRTEDVYKSYRELQNAFGKRIHDLSPEARRALVASVPDDMREAWSAELKAKLVEDPEFLTPLQEKWRAENAPQVPESYAVPDELRIDAEHPATTGLMEFAKEHHLSQEAFQKLAEMGRDLLAPYEVPMTEDQLREAIGPDLAPRAMATGNRIRAMLGPQLGNDLLLTMRRPEHFLALERLVQASSEKPLPLGGEPPQQLTEAKLREMQQDPRYRVDKDYTAEVTKLFSKFYGNVI